MRQGVSVFLLQYSCSTGKQDVSHVFFPPLVRNGSQIFARCQFQIFGGIRASRDNLLFHLGVYRICGRWVEQKRAWKDNHFVWDPLTLIGGKNRNKIHSVNATPYKMGKIKIPVADKYSSSLHMRDTKCTKGLTRKGGGGIIIRTPPHGRGISSQGTVKDSSPFQQQRSHCTQNIMEGRNGGHEEKQKNQRRVNRAERLCCSLLKR